MDNNQEHRGLLRHVVSMKFKDSVTAEQRSDVAARFSKLQDKIPEIADFEWGTDVSVDGLSEGITHVFLMTFKSAKDRNAYLIHDGKDTK